MGFGAEVVLSLVNELGKCYFFFCWLDNFM
jgi:hypothetical protein